MTNRVQYLFFVLACTSFLTVSALAQDFVFNSGPVPFDPNPPQYGSPNYPYLFGSLSLGTKIFSVDDQKYGFNSDAINYFHDYFTFSLTTKAMVTVAISPGSNTGYLGFNGSGFGAGSFLNGGADTNRYGSVSQNVPLLPGNYSLESFGVITTNNGFLYYDMSYSGSIAVTSLPLVSIGNASVVEGKNGTTNATFTVSLSQICPLTVAVRFVTADGSATTGNDYQAAFGFVTFSPGQTNQTIAVTVNGNVNFEPNKTFFVNLDNPSVAGNSFNLDISPAQGVGTIINEISPPTFQSVTQTNGTIYLTWSITPGQTYQLQSNTNLSSTNWLNLGSSATASTTTVSASDSITNSQCFYRVMVLQ